MTDTTELVLTEQLQNLQKMRLLIDAFGIDTSVVCEDVDVPQPPEELLTHPAYAAYLADVAALSPKLKTLLIPQQPGTMVRTYYATPCSRNLRANDATLTAYDQRIYTAVRAVRQLLAAQLLQKRRTA